MTNIDQDDTTKKAKKKKEGMGESFKTAIIAVFFALLIRTFAFEPFNIPSGSMVPTLLVGDYLFTSKYAYGYSKHSFPLSMGPFEGRIMQKIPERGDIIVFKLPSNERIDYIKRVIGLPGDRVQYVDGQLYLNEEVVPRLVLGREDYTDDFGETMSVTKYQETLPNAISYTIYEVYNGGRLDNTPVYTVPQGHVFMMGDNRDNSADSRVMEQVGFVPIENLVGRAEFLFFSTDGSAALYEPWKWPLATRWSRLLDSLRPEKDLQAQ